MYIDGLLIISQLFKQILLHKLAMTSLFCKIYFSFLNAIKQGQIIHFGKYLYYICMVCFETNTQLVSQQQKKMMHIGPKLKLSLFALYRPTRKYPANSKNFIGKKVLLFFLLVTTVYRITFYSIYTETITEKLEINAISRQLLCLLVSLVLDFLNYI